MFSKGNKAASRDQKTEAPAKGVPSIVSADLVITGDLASKGEIQVDGRIEGDVKCSALIIGKTGCVVGEIEADVVRLHGEVKGQVRAKTVYLASTARMIGDITHESLAIEPGALMEGHCRRMVPGAAAPTLPVAEPPPRKVELSIANELRKSNASFGKRDGSDDVANDEKSEAAAG